MSDAWDYDEKPPSNRPRLVPHVKDAFQAAKENGETFEGWAVEKIAVDMLTYNSDLENEEMDDVVHAIEYLEEQGWKA